MDIRHRKPGEYKGRGVASVPLSVSVTPEVDYLLRTYAASPRHLGAFIGRLVYQFHDRLQDARARTDSTVDQCVQEAVAHVD